METRRAKIVFNNTVIILKQNYFKGEVEHLFNNATVKRK